MTPQHHALYLVHALTPLRVGADQGLGAIDLPTLREAHTGWPILPGSSVKGVLREQAELHFMRGLPVEPTDDAEKKKKWRDDRRKREHKIESIFGPPTDRAGDFRGGVVFGDAYPLLLPVRSMAGTFAWVTCAQVMRRLLRDATEAGITLECPKAPANDHVLVVADPNQIILEGPKQVLLEDICLTAKHDATAAQWGKIIAEWLWPSNLNEERQFLLARLAVVPDDVFSYFCRHRLEIRTRVSIDHETGTANKSGPWTEELIPAETVLCGILQARGTTIRERNEGDRDAGANSDALGAEHEKKPDEVFEHLREVLEIQPTLRIGGNASIGLGRTRVTLSPATRSPQESTT